jgi:CRISPR-associated protein (TIGR03984 family)
LKTSNDLATNGRLEETLLRESKPILNGAKTYLLSFHDDGVVWGKIKNGKLETSDNLPDTPSPQFRAETLQECRLFSDKGELYIWRNGNDFKARLIEDSLTDTDAEEREHFEEKQVLWGTQIKNGNDEFTVVADGSEGLHHAFPQKVDDVEFKVKDDKGKVVKNDKGEDVRKRPLRLGLRHYLSYDGDGCAYVSLSRLVNVEVEGGK